MNKIIHKYNFADKFCLFDVEVKYLTRDCLPGQFLIVKIDDK